MKPKDSHRALLEAIRQTSTPIVNPVEVLLKGYDRLSMLNEMRQAGLPVVDYEVCLGKNILWGVNREFPFVVKFGNYHGGYGKVLVKDAHQWADLKDMAFLINEYITIEPYIEYSRDIRCLMIDNEVFGTSRSGMFWKANHITTKVEHIHPPDEIVEYTSQAMDYLDADILGLDFLETMDGEYILLESNDIPGIREYPDIVKEMLAHTLIDKLSVNVT